MILEYIEMIKELVCSYAFYLGYWMIYGEILQHIQVAQCFKFSVLRQSVK